jgi:hypothetical protein
MLRTLLNLATASVLAVAVTFNGHYVGTQAAFAGCATRACDEVLYRADRIEGQWAAAGSYGYTAKNAEYLFGADDIGGQDIMCTFSVCEFRIYNTTIADAKCGDVAVDGVYEVYSLTGPYQVQTNNWDRWFCADEDGYGVDHSWNDYYDKNGDPEP